MSSCVGYIFSRFSENNFRYPQHIQNLVNRTYAKELNFDFKLSATEYSLEKCYIVLNNLINTDENKNIIIFSYNILPDKLSDFYKILRSSITNNKNIYFALEKFNLVSDLDLDQLMSIKKINIAMESYVKRN